MEGLTLYRLLGKKKTATESNSTWIKIVENNKLPERSAESIKKFWQQHENKTQEVFLCESIHNKIDFCFSFKEIPDREELEARLRGIHSDVFESLEAADQEHSSDNEPVKAKDNSVLLMSGSTQVSQAATQQPNVEEFKVSSDGTTIKMKIVKKVQTQPYRMNKDVGSLLGKRSFSTL